MDAFDLAGNQFAYELDELPARVVQHENDHLDGKLMSEYADKRGAPVAIIQGSDEAARGVVQIKDLILGAEIAETATLEEWKDQPAQFECPLDDLVARVREILER